jgi:tartrate dehydrogenase/decarboxylase / D-malate dehydrogenase
MDATRIAIYPGDGIGIEVTVEVVKILEALKQSAGLPLELTEFDWGERHWRAHGMVAPEDYLKQLRDFDAIFLGALGDPENVPDHVTLKPLIGMRQGFDQYACVRPAKLLPGLETPLAGKGEDQIDLLIVRENSEGEYIDAGGFLRPGAEDGSAVQVAVHSRKGVERILRYGFELARTRKRRLTMATKSNALKYGMVFWDQVFEKIAPEYGDVASEKCHVDALAMNFVRRPEAYDVVVASNLFGDILSDIGGTISGGLGLAPSANINPERSFPSLFEPVHGSAPDIKGRGLANPIAAIRSAAMMLAFLGHTEASAQIDRAVQQVLAEGQVRTPDIGGSATTETLGDAIMQALSAD